MWWSLAYYHTETCCTSIPLCNFFSTNAWWMIWMPENTSFIKVQYNDRNQSCWSCCQGSHPQSAGCPQLQHVSCWQFPLSQLNLAVHQCFAVQCYRMWHQGVYSPSLTLSFPLDNPRLDVLAPYIWSTSLAASNSTALTAKGEAGKGDSWKSEHVTLWTQRSRVFSCLSAGMWVPYDKWLNKQ